MGKGTPVLAGRLRGGLCVRQLSFTIHVNKDPQMLNALFARVLASLPLWQGLLQQIAILAFFSSLSDCRRAMRRLSPTLLFCLDFTFLSGLYGAS